MIRGLGGFIEAANALLIGTGFVGAAIFYLFVEILRYPLAQMPTLGPWRWMRYSWMALFLLIGVAALASGLALLVNPLSDVFRDMSTTLSQHLPAPIASVLMFIIGLFLPFSFGITPLLIASYALLLRDAADEMRRAITWRKLQRQ